MLGISMGSDGCDELSSDPFSDVKGQFISSGKCLRTTVKEITGSNHLCFIKMRHYIIFFFFNFSKISATSLRISI